MAESTAGDVDRPERGRFRPDDGERRVERALDALEERGRRLDREREAFAAFVRRVEGIDTETVSPSTAPRGPRPLATDPPDVGQGAATVLAAYRDTVLAVEHYAEGTGDPLESHVETELGSTVAGALFGGGPLTPQLRAALVREARNASRRRASVAERVAAEREALAEAAAELAEIEAAAAETLDGVVDLEFDALCTRFERIEELEERLDGLLRDRQGAIGERDDVVHRYLYGDLEAAYPVLADGARVMAALEDAERYVTRLIASRA